MSDQLSVEEIIALVKGMSSADKTKIAAALKAKAPAAKRAPRGHGAVRFVEMPTPDDAA